MLLIKFSSSTVSPSTRATINGSTTIMLPFIVVRATGDTVDDENRKRIIALYKYAEIRTSALLVSL